MTKIEPIPPRGDVASIEEKRDFRGPSSRRSSPMGGSASRPKGRSVGSLPYPTAGTAPTTRQSNSGAASPNRWCAVHRAPSTGKVEIRSCLRGLPGSASDCLLVCLRRASNCLRFCFGGAVARIALRNSLRRTAPEPELVHRGSLPVVRHGTQSPLLAVLAFKTQPPTVEAGAHHGSLSSRNRWSHAPHFPLFSVRRFEVYVWHSYLCV